MMVDGKQIKTKSCTGTTPLNRFSVRNQEGKNLIFLTTLWKLYIQNYYTIHSFYNSSYLQSFKGAHTPLYRQENTFPVYLSRQGAKPIVKSILNQQDHSPMIPTFTLCIRKYVIPKRTRKKKFCQADICIYHIISAKSKVTIFLHFLQLSSTIAQCSSSDSNTMG